MSELYPVVDAFLKRKYQEGPALYQIITDAESLASEKFKPYLRELEIPAGWKYVEPEDEKEGETA